MGLRHLNTLRTVAAALLDRDPALDPGALRAGIQDLAIEVRAVNGGGGELRFSGHGTMVPKNRFP
jgi:hypothetical protein